jgi:Ca-activated chloride channel homolog
LLHFEHTNYLFALLLIPLLIVLFKYIQSKKEKTAKKIGNPVLVKLLTANYNHKKFTIKYFLLVLVVAISILSLANLRQPNGNSLIKKTGVDVMVALDVSKSMLAKDIQPNRLERAKQQINKLIDLLPNDRIGLVVFAGKAYMQMPLTADHAAAKMYVNAASTDIISTQGTVISDALKICNSAFNPLEKKYKSIVLISDGEDHDENAEQTATALANQGVIINTIGIGSTSGANIFDEILNEPKKDNEGNIIVTKLNETK